MARGRDVSSVGDPWGSPDWGQWGLTRVRVSPGGVGGRSGVNTVDTTSTGGAALSPVDSSWVPQSLGLGPWPWGGVVGVPCTPTPPGLPLPVGALCVGGGVGGGGRRLGLWNLFHGSYRALGPGMRVLVSRVGRLTSRELGAWPPTSRLVSGCRAPWMGSGPGFGLGLVLRSWRLWGSVSSAGDRVGCKAQAQVRGQGHGEHAMGSRRCASSFDTCSTVAACS